MIDIYRYLHHVKPLNQYRLVVQKRAVTYQSRECTNESTSYSSMLTRSPGEEAPNEHVDLGRSIMFLVYRFLLVVYKEHKIKKNAGEAREVIQDKDRPSNFPDIRHVAS